MGKNNKNSWYINLLKLLKLETTTPSGRINLAGVIVLAIFCILYTTQDAFMFFVAAISDTVKSVALGQDIYNPYESSSVIQVIIPIFLGFLICIVFLYVDDKKKSKLKKDDNQEEKNPVENL